MLGFLVYFLEETPAKELFHIFLCCNFTFSCMCWRGRSEAYIHACIQTHIILYIHIYMGRERDASLCVQTWGWCQDPPSLPVLYSVMQGLPVKPRFCCCCYLDPAFSGSIFLAFWFQCSNPKRIITPCAHSLCRSSGIQMPFHTCVANV